jgi:hypothetical protein
MEIKIEAWQKIWGYGALNLNFFYQAELRDLHWKYSSTQYKDIVAFGFFVSTKVLLA